MAQMLFSVKLIVLVLLSWSDASPLKHLPTYDDLAAARAQYDDITPSTHRKQSALNAIIDPTDGKLKEKPLFNLDPSSFIKLKALKVIPTDSNTSNIMRLYFPRNKNVEKAIKSDAKLDDSKTNEPTISSVNQFSEKDLKKDFIEVDDILMVRDPKNIDALIKNEQIDEVVSSVSQATPPVQSTQNDDSKPGKKSLESLFNQSVRYKKLVNSLNAKKSGKIDSFSKSPADRELFKREGTFDDKMNDNLDSSNQNREPDVTSMNRDFEIVSIPLETNETSATHTVETHTENIDQIQVATEAGGNDENLERMTQKMEKIIDPHTKTVSNINATKTENHDDDDDDDDFRMVGASLQTIVTDEKNLLNDAIKLTNERKIVEEDEKKVNASEATLDKESDTLEKDRLKVSDDTVVLMTDLDEASDVGSHHSTPDIHLTTPMTYVADKLDEAEPSNIETKSSDTVTAPEASTGDSEADTIKDTNEEGAMLGASLQSSQVDSDQEINSNSPTTIEPNKSVSELIGSAPEAIGDDDGMVGMALSQVKDDVDTAKHDVHPATAEQTDANQTLSEAGAQNDESVSTQQPLETSKDVAQTPVDEKVTHEGESSNLENEEMLGASFVGEQSATDKPDDAQINIEKSIDNEMGRPMADAQVSSTQQDETSSAKSADDQDSVVAMALQTTEKTIASEDENVKLENAPNENESTTNSPDQMLGEALANSETGNTELAENVDELVGASHRSDSGRQSDRNASETDQDTRNRNANRSGNNNKNERNTSSSSNSESSAESESRNHNDGSSQILININNNSNSRSSDTENENASADQESNSGRSNAESNNRSNTESNNGSNTQSDASGDSNGSRRSNNQSNNRFNSESDSHRENSPLNTQTNANTSRRNNAQANNRETSQRNGGSNSQSDANSDASSKSGSNSESNGRQTNSNNNAAAQSDPQTSQKSAQSSSNSDNQSRNSGSQPNQGSSSPNSTSSGSESANANQNGERSGDGDLLKLLPFQGVHPLLSRILLGAAAPMRASQTPLRQLLNQQRRTLFTGFPLRPSAIRIRRSVKRDAKEEDVFVTPQPYESFQKTTTCRPSLIERYRAMSSDERAERASRFLEKVMHGVKIVGHVDGFLTSRAKSGIKKIHKMFATSEEI